VTKALLVGRAHQGVGRAFAVVFSRIRSFKIRCASSTPDVSP
jgi:hypothetical protein